MKTHHAADLTNERYVVEVDEIAKFEYCVFVKALTAGLRLKQEFPNCCVKLHDADENTSLIPH